jgi:hypothetical protein
MCHNARQAGARQQKERSEMGGRNWKWEGTTIVSRLRVSLIFTLTFSVHSDFAFPFRPS